MVCQEQITVYNMILETLFVPKTEEALCLKNYQSIELIVD